MPLVLELEGNISEMLGDICFYLVDEFIKIFHDFGEKQYSIGSCPAFR